MPLDLETVCAPLAEVKFADDGAPTFAGYAAVFGDLDAHNDVIVAGAFKGSLRARMPKMLWQHDQSRPIGKWTEVREDAKGLRVAGEILTGVQAGREALELVKAGVVDGMSIGYRTVKSSYRKDGVRELKELDLLEISLVTFPAQQNARVAKRDWNPLEIEDVLRSAGVPRRFAERLVKAGFDAATTDGRRVADDGVNDSLSRLIATIEGTKP